MIILLYMIHIFNILTVGGGCGLSAEISDCIVGGSSAAANQLLQTTDRVVCEILNENPKRWCSARLMELVTIK